MTEDYTADMMRRSSSSLSGKVATIFDSKQSTNKTGNLSSNFGGAAHATGIGKAS